jgi:chromosome segregation ATPase
VGDLRQLFAMANAAMAAAHQRLGREESRAGTLEGQVAELRAQLAATTTALGLAHEQAAALRGANSVLQEQLRAERARADNEASRRVQTERRAAVSDSNLTRALAAVDEITAALGSLKTDVARALPQPPGPPPLFGTNSPPAVSHPSAC